MNGIEHYLARRYLFRENAAHVKKYPQVAGFAFDLITQCIHLEGRFSNDELTFLSERVLPLLSPGGICIDIGANIGNHSLAFSPHFARIFAFEPHPRLFKLLDINSELATNIRPINFGVSNVASVVRVQQDPLNYGATSVRGFATLGGVEVVFHLDRLDEFSREWSDEVVTFIKIDVEGHEAETLIGAEQTIRKSRPLIALEVLKQDVKDGTSTSLDLLRSFGYRYFYELRESGFLGRLPRRVKKIFRSLITLSTGRRPSKAAELGEVHMLENRNYSMLLCSINPMVIDAENPRHPA